MSIDYIRGTTGMVLLVGGAVFLVGPSVPLPCISGTTPPAGHRTGIAGTAVPSHRLCRGGTPGLPWLGAPCLLLGVALIVWQIHGWRKGAAAYRKSLGG